MHVNYDMHNSTRYVNSDNARWTMWEISRDLIQQNPIAGIGTGDVEKEFILKFKEYSFQKGLDEKFKKLKTAYTQVSTTDMSVYDWSISPCYMVRIAEF